MKLSEFMVKEAIVAQLQGTSRDETIRELVASLAQAGRIGTEQVDDIV